MTPSTPPPRAAWPPCRRPDPRPAKEHVPVTEIDHRAASPFAPPDDPLALDRETMRALGHQTVDALVDLLTDPATPALRRASADEMTARLPAGPAPEGPGEWDGLVQRLSQDVFPFMSRLDHPGYFAYIPACGTFPGALGDLMASVLNLDVGSWMQSAGPSRLELVVLDWFRQWIGYPEGAAGVLGSGGAGGHRTPPGGAPGGRGGGPGP